MGAGGLRKRSTGEAIDLLGSAVRIHRSDFALGRRNDDLSRQLRTILPIIVVLTVVMFLSIYVVPPTAEASEEFPVNTQIKILQQIMLD